MNEPVMIINPELRKHYKKFITIDIDDNSIDAVECEGFEYENNNLRINFKVLQQQLYKDNLAYCKEQMKLFSSEIKSGQSSNAVLI